MPSSHHTRVLPFEQARQVVEEHAKRLRPKGRELLLLLDGAGRVLAEDIHADRDIPPFARATRDGYALRAADVLKLPANLDLVAEVRAGVGVKDLPPLEPGEAISIMTGAIALAAAVGRARVLVHEKPRVAVLSTGDEVVDIDVVPGPNQIRNSNSYSLAAQIAQAGAEAVLLPIAPDEPARLRELLAEAFDSDLVLIAGGVSMGRYDLVEQELAALQAEFFFSGANIQPGKPIVFGRVEPGTWAGHPGQQPKYFFGLPGNPISTMVTFELFAKVLVQALAGIGPQPLKFLHAKLGKRVHTKTGLKRFLPARVSGEFENAQVELTPWQGSGDIASVARSNCFLVIGPDRESIEAGEWVPVLLR
jgi:molybdopterin molybdotransferase